MSEARIQPFVLETGLETPAEITVKPPTGDVLLAISENSGNPRLVLQLICGDQYAAVMDLVGPAPAEVMTSLIEDMTGHFGLTGNSGDSDASSN